MGKAAANGPVVAEAAAAILLSRSSGPDSLAFLSGIGAAEPSLGDQSNLGKGIRSAVDKAMARVQLPGLPIGTLVHDFPQARAGFEELAWLKGSLSLPTTPDLLTLAPNFSVGETGAASEVLCLVTLAFLMGKGVAANQGLCLFASEGAIRGASVLTPAQQTKK
jgi:hypothetical protein